MTSTYYVHLDHSTDRPTGPRARYLGTARYGYKSLKVAIQMCPPGSYVLERHCNGSNDWAGNIKYVAPEKELA